MSPYLLAPAAYVKSLDSEGYADECRCLMHLDHHAESGGMGDGVYLAAGVHPHFQLLWQRVRAHQQCCACWQPCGCVRTVQMQSCMSSGSTSEPAEFPPQVLSLEPRVLQWVPSQNKRCTGLALDPCDAKKEATPLCSKRTIIEQWPVDIICFPALASGGSTQEV